MHPEANAKADHRAITRLTKMRVVISISTQDGSAALDENSFWRGRILCRELKRSMQPQKKMDTADFSLDRRVDPLEAEIAVLKQR